MPLGSMTLRRMSYTRRPSLWRVRGWLDYDLSRRRSKVSGERKEGGERGEGREEGRVREADKRERESKRI